MCSRWSKTVNIPFKKCVNVSQLIQNVNIPFEICVNGSVGTENCALAYGANVFYIKTLICHCKYCKRLGTTPFSVLKLNRFLTFSLYVMKMLKTCYVFEKLLGSWRAVYTYFKWNINVCMWNTLAIMRKNNFPFSRNHLHIFPMQYWGARDEGSGNVRGKFEECSGCQRVIHEEATARTSCGHLYGILIIPPLKPSSEFAIKELP